MKCEKHAIEMLCPACLGERGGSVQSPRQIAARIRNSKKGGWPKGRKRGVWSEERRSHWQERLGLQDVKQAIIENQKEKL